MRKERERFTRLLEEGQRAVDGAYLLTAQRILELATRAKFRRKEEAAAKK